MTSADEWLPREIKYIILHSSAAHVAEVNTYHFYLSVQGRVHQTLPLSLPGKHTPGFDRHSIGICYAGGMDRDGHLADTRSQQQKLSLQSLIRDLRQLFPGVQFKMYYECRCNNPR